MVTVVQVKKKSKPKKSTKGDKDNTNSSEAEDMSVQEKLDIIMNKLEQIEGVKNEISQLRSEMEKLTDRAMERMDKIESDVFDLKANQDRLGSEITKLQEENTSLRSQLNQQKIDLANCKFVENEAEQHGRSWNVRVFGIKEGGQGKVETTADCVTKVTTLFTEKLGVAVTGEDIEVAHRTGKPGTGRARPIIVRFYSRQKKKSVLENRRKLKQTGVTVAEDLTKLNYNLLMKASKHSAALTAWSSNGNILVKAKNGNVVKIDIKTNLENTLVKAMA